MSIFRKAAEKIQVSLNSNNKNSSLHGDLCTLMIIYLAIVRMRNASYISFTENQNTHFMFNNFFPKVVPFITWKNMV